MAVELSLDGKAAKLTAKVASSLRKGGGLIDAPGRGLVGANTENPH
jgi:hypothetical protein